MNVEIKRLLEITWIMSHKLHGFFSINICSFLKTLKFQSKVINCTPQAEIPGFDIVYKS